MLSSSQQAASELLLKRLEEGRGAVALQGLSGSGKSHVAEKTLGGGSGYPDHRYRHDRLQNR